AVVDRVGDVISNGARGRLGEHAGPRYRSISTIAECVHVREPRRQVARVHGDPAIIAAFGQFGFGNDNGYAVDRDADEQVVWTHLVPQFGDLAVWIQLAHPTVGEVVDVPIG